MVIAAEGAVFAATWNAVVHFHALRLLRGAIRPHRRVVFERAREDALGRPLRRCRTTQPTCIFIAPLRGTARERPPVVGPKRRCAAIAAPRPAPRSEFRTAPRTATGARLGERTHGDERRALRRCFQVARATISRRYVTNNIARATPTDAAANKMNASETTMPVCPPPTYPRTA